MAASNTALNDGFPEPYHPSLLTVGFCEIVFPNPANFTDDFDTFVGAHAAHPDLATRETGDL